MQKSKAQSKLGYTLEFSFTESWHCTYRIGTGLLQILGDSRTSRCRPKWSKTPRWGKVYWRTAEQLQQENVTRDNNLNWFAKEHIWWE